MHDADDSVAIQTEGALARLQERLEEREACFAIYVWGTIGGGQLTNHLHSYFHL